MASDERKDSNFTRNETDENAKQDNLGKSAITRRKFVAGMGAITGFAISHPGMAGATLQDPVPVSATPTVPLEISINGTVHRLAVDSRVTLLDLLREHLGLTGTKKGCDHGQCGSCTVLANGRRINSCLSLAAVHDGESIMTVEGIAANSELSPLQAAFLEHDGLQCGYCTPGQLCSATAMLDEVEHGDASIVTEDLSSMAKVELTADEIRERMSGNLCRCGAYPGIVAAVQQVHSQRAGRS